MLKLSSLYKTRPMTKTIGPKGQIGFWLPAEPGPFAEENRGKSSLQIWMEYDAEYDRFLGSITLGHHYHVEVYRFKKTRSGWKINDDRADSFIGQMVDGNSPQTFRIRGFRGEWVIVVSPYT